MPADARRRLASNIGARKGGTLKEDVRAPNSARLSSGAENGAIEALAEGTAGPPAPADVLDGAIAVYCVAYDELRRQVSTTCRERGSLMGSLWTHFFRLVAAKQALAYESEMRVLLEDRESLEDEIAAARGALPRAEARLAESDSKHNAEVAKLELEKRKLAKAIVRTEGVVRARDATIRELNATLRSEVDARERVVDKMRETERDLRSANNEVERANSARERLQAALEAARADLEDRETGLLRACDERNRLENELHAQTQRANAAESRLARLADEIGSEKARVTSLEASLREKSDSVARMGDLLKEKADESARLTRDLSAADTRARDADRELAETSRAKRQVDLVYVQLVEDHERARARVKSLELTIDGEREDSATNLRQYKEYRRTAAKVQRDLEMKLEARIKRHEALEQDHIAAKDEIGLHRAELRKLSDALQLSAQAGAELAADEEGKEIASTHAVRDEVRAPSEVEAEWRTYGPGGRMMRTLHTAARILAEMRDALQQTQRAREVARQRFEAEASARQAAETKVYEEKRRNAALVRQLNETTNGLKEAREAIERLEKRSVRS